MVVKPFVNLCNHYRAQICKHCFVFYNHSSFRFISPRLLESVFFGIVYVLMVRQYDTHWTLSFSKLIPLEWPLNVKAVNPFCRQRTNKRKNASVLSGKRKCMVLYNKKTIYVKLESITVIIVVIV